MPIIRRWGVHVPRGSLNWRGGSYCRHKMTPNPLWYQKRKDRVTSPYNDELPIQCLVWMGPTTTAVDCHKLSMNDKQNLWSTLISMKWKTLPLNYKGRPYHGRTMIIQITVKLGRFSQFWFMDLGCYCTCCSWLDCCCSSCCNNTSCGDHHDGRGAVCQCRCCCYHNLSLFKEIVYILIVISIVFLRGTTGGSTCQITILADTAASPH